MATIDAHDAIAAELTGATPADFYKPAPHFFDRDHEFDTVKFGIWLFLGTEILLFSGMFCAYGVMRMIHPEAFVHGSSLLEIHWGLINTIVLLVSSYTVAAGVRHAQTGNRKWLLINIAITFLCGLVFILVKFIFEYWPKYQLGKLPGMYYSYPYYSSEYEPIWWGIYWGATGIHASHVLVGMGLFTWLFVRARRGDFGPRHYNAVEGVGLYWHIVDIVWIFLFPLLYLIH